MKFTFYLSYAPVDCTLSRNESYFVFILFLFFIIAFLTDGIVETFVVLPVQVYTHAKNKLIDLQMEVF